MKIAFLPIAFCAILFGFSSCKTDQSITLTLKKSTTFTLPGSTVSGYYVNLDADAVATEINQLASDNKTTIPLLEEATLTNLVITLTEPTNTTVSFINEIELFLKNAAGDTLAIAKKDTLTSSDKVLSTITLTPIKRTDLINWVTQENLHYVARLRTNSYLPEDRIFTISSTYSIDGTREP